MNRDLTSCIDAAESLRPAVHDADVDGQTVDLLGADSAAIVVTVGAITGTADDSAIVLEESDASGSGFTAVADADILGSEPTALEPNTAYQFGYIGNKRYIRVTFAIGGETDVTASGMVLRGHLSQEPAGYSTAS
jgi:hypothetical protein